GIWAERGRATCCDAGGRREPDALRRAKRTQTTRRPHVARPEDAGRARVRRAIVQRRLNLLRRGGRWGLRPARVATASRALRLRRDRRDAPRLATRQRNAPDDAGEREAVCERGPLAEKGDAVDRR